jgi:rfaE bifunctional protein nucleotidyltransferase chain/domain
MNIWVNGCFDILHTGHIDLLNFAKSYGDEDNRLIVGLDNDGRIKKLKGDNRPINDISTRLTIIDQLKVVDDVCVFNTDEELEFFIQSYEIDYIIIGDDYKEKRVVGSEFAKRGVVYYPINNFKSTTNIIGKIKTLC